MIFRMVTTKQKYNDIEKRKYINLGFKFAPLAEADGLWKIDNSQAEINFTSVEQIANFGAKIGHPLIVAHKVIEIYNDKREKSEVIT